uniref:Uncharacterized protein n=1 Tax=Rhizophora mucronata TaxID=61149 RepID=A0A2P2JWK1_RHIMU
MMPFMIIFSGSSYGEFSIIIGDHIFRLLVQCLAMLYLPFDKCILCTSVSCQ